MASCDKEFSMPVEYTKNLVGKPIVKFDCPNCQLRLSAMLSEAGSRDKCPECGQGFKVPGQQKLRDAEEKRKKALEAKAAAKQKKIDEARAKKSQASQSGHIAAGDSSGVVTPHQAEKTSEVDDRWLVDPNEDLAPPPIAQPFSEDHVALDETQSAASSLSDSSGQQNPGIDFPSYAGGSRAVGDQHVRRMKLRYERAWWKDSIRFEPVSAARYPALMAFRNLLVLTWWIMAIGSVAGFICYPLVMIYGGYTQHSMASRRFDQQVEVYDNPKIESLLYRPGQGLTAAEASQLALEFESYDYSGFSMRNRIAFNDPVSSDVLAMVADAWREWTDSRKRAINQQRPSVFMAFLTMLLSICIYWVAQVISFLVFSILILVPPECIKLAIDIEQGVRAGNAGSETD